VSNIFYKPHLNGDTVYFPYTREKLCERPVFPTFVLDGGASFFAMDQFKTIDGDRLLGKIMDGSLFEYWERDGEFDWNAAFKDFRPIGYASEWEGHIWINRLYVLLPLAQEYCKTKDKKYASKWLEILKDFMSKNPYTRYEDKPVDLVWRDMQVTWRTISIVHSIFFIGEADPFDKEDWDFIYETVKTHANHMLNEGERHVSNPEPDNHRLQIATTITMFSALFPEFFDREKSLEIATKLIVLNMEKSIFQDGCNNEDSLSYSHFIARLYLEAELYLKYNGLKPIDKLSESVKTQYEFLYNFSSPKGQTLQFGDSYVFDAVGDVEFVNSFYPLPFVRERKTRLFADSRMAVLKNGDFTVYVDAMDMTEWHQHYGRPQFVVFHGETPLVVDSGSVNYDRGWIRRRLNSEAGHNVISCAQIPLTRRPSNESLTVTEFSDGDVKVLEILNKVTGENKGYDWVRRFMLYEDRLEVIDTVKATEKLNFTSRLYLPDCRVGYAPAEPCYTGTEEKLRFGSFMECVRTETPYEIEFTPCVDGTNRMNYAECLVRKFEMDNFTEKTVISFEKIRDKNEYYMERLPEFVR
jgi:hypothetical protein